MSNDFTMVLGLGNTGISVIRHLQSRESHVYACDSRLGRQTNQIPHLSTVRTNFPEVEIVPPRRFARAVADFKRVVASPGIALDDSLLKFAEIERVPIVGDIDLFLDEVSVPVIGITGTNGKSTTTMLVGEMLRKKGYQICGNIGLPVLDALNSDAAGFVVELSSFQLERLNRPRFAVAVITNIAEDHLDHHNSMVQYISSKQRIYQNCGFAVYNGTDDGTRPQEEVASVAVDNDSDWRIVDQGIVVAGELIQSAQIALKGKHNYFNLVAASAVAHHMGSDLATIKHVARTFEGLPHRSQSIAVVDGIEFINDSKATNVAAATSTIQGLAAGGRDLVLIAGGDAKNADFGTFAETVGETVRHVVLIGRDAKRIADCLHSTDYEFASSMEYAVSRARDVAEPGGCVLLAPACASYDMYENFEQRGEAFATAVRGLRK